MKDLDKNNKYTDTPEKGISEYDVVNKPRHYNRDGAMECIDEMILLFGPAETASYCKLNAWKYRYRAADKNGMEDLRKSDWYMKKYKELKNDIDKDIKKLLSPFSTSCQ